MTFQEAQMSVELALANWKGGVGKSQTTITFATQLSMLGLRVLVIDADPQGNAGSGLGYTDFVGLNLFDVLLNKSDIKACLLQTAIDMETQQYFDPRSDPERPSRPGPMLLPINKEATGADFDLKSKITNWSQQLNKKLKSIRHLFDYILIDCGPSLGTLTTNAFNAVRNILIPTVPEKFVLEGLASLLGIIAAVQADDNEEVRVTGIFFSMVLSNWRAHSDIKQSLRDPGTRAALMGVFGEDAEPLRIFETEIKHNAAIASATNEGSVIVLNNAKSPYAKDYWFLLAEVIAVIGGAASLLLPQVVAKIKEEDAIRETAKREGK